MNEAYAKLVGALEDGDILHRFPSLADALWLACQRPVERQDHGQLQHELTMSQVASAQVGMSIRGHEPPSKSPAPTPDITAESPPLTIQPLHITIDTAEPDELRAVVPSEGGTGHAPRGPSVEIPSLPSLPKRDLFIRQLKLLRRLHPSLRRRTLNLDATVRRFCEEEIPEPVFWPGYEQTLNLTFLVDESPTMDMWRNMASEFFDVLRASAAFQRSRAFLWSVTLEEGQARASYSPLASTDETDSGADHAGQLEFSVHDVVVLFSDCTARRWYRSDCLAEWREWARRAHVVVVNPLPQRFWPRTSLEAAQRVNLRIDQVASPNASLRVSAPLQTAADSRQDQTIALPIVAPDPAHLLAWSRFMALRRRSFPGRLYSIGDQQRQIPAREPKPLTSRERLAMFKRQARPEAVELARLVAASPIINLPIVRLLRSRLLAPGRPGVDPHDCSYDAEVMLSPLLQVAPIDKKEKRPAEPDQVLYRFPDEKDAQDVKGMRAALVAELPRARIQEVFDTIGFYIEHEAEELQAGQFHGFVAMLHNPEQAAGDELWRVHEIVQIAARIIFRRLGGKYAELLKSAGQPRFLSDLNAQLGLVEDARQQGDIPEAQQILQNACQAAEESNWGDAGLLLAEQLAYYRGLLRVQDLVHEGGLPEEPPERTLIVVRRASVGLGRVDEVLTDDQTNFVLKDGLMKADLDGRSLLVLIPDETRSCPLPNLFRHVVDLLAPRVAKLDFLIALGTHQPVPEERINKLLGISTKERQGKYANIGFFNHLWEEEETYALLGEIPPKRIKEITEGLVSQKVQVAVNRMILDYDCLAILGPTSPHEVVGFSGGLTYFFPGVSNWEFINFIHWLGAVTTCVETVGRKDTPVRRVINEAAKLIPKPVFSINVVVHEGDLAGCFIGDPLEAWESAADLSDKLHIIYNERPYSTVLGIAPEMYDDIWTAGRVMYKLEAIVADGGELIIYAPHINEISLVHGKHLDKIGYHVRDYFLKQPDRFADVPAGVMAHSTHLRGAGTYEDGVEKPRITVTLATGIPRERTEAVALSYRDPQLINPDDYRGRESEGILVVDNAGEVTHRLRDD